ncbi:MAG: DUF4491 family protein [Chloroflexaceae bacterium]|nr:DUF4491 family protein [Chloroflexaceae bacterium]
MALEWSGFCMALATFLGIWSGHVGVRWIEAHSVRIVLPIVLFMIGGIGLNLYSLFAPNLVLAGVSSILGITFIWDAAEICRQQKRVRLGHAPANPNNPRHAAFLQHGSATCDDLLDREPTGQPVVVTTADANARTSSGDTTDHTYREVQI